MTPHLKGLTIHLRGTLETVTGVALVQGRDSDGNPVYTGKTELWWEEEATVYRSGQRIWVDYDGNEWCDSEVEWRECDSACE